MGGLVIANRRRLPKLLEVSRTASPAIYAAAKAPIVRHQRNQYETIHAELTGIPVEDMLTAIDIVEQFVYKDPSNVSIADARRRSGKKMEADPSAETLLTDLINRRIDLTSTALLARLSAAEKHTDDELTRAYRRAVRIFKQVGKLQKLPRPQEESAND